MGRTLTKHKTLATKVEVYVDTDNPPVLNDTLVEVITLYGGNTAVWFGRGIDGASVRVELSGAERIALIEALGGHDSHESFVAPSDLTASLVRGVLNDFQYDGGRSGVFTLAERIREVVG